MFTSYRANNPDLYRKEIYTGKEAKISFKQGLNVAGRMAPNEREIALTLSKDGNPEIYLIGVTGRVRKRITDNWGIDSDPSWSPDGAVWLLSPIARATRTSLLPTSLAARRSA